MTYPLTGTGSDPTSPAVAAEWTTVTYGKLEGSSLDWSDWFDNFEFEDGDEIIYDSDTNEYWTGDEDSFQSR